MWAPKPTTALTALTSTSSSEDRSVRAQGYGAGGRAVPGLALGHGAVLLHVERSRSRYASRSRSSAWPLTTAPALDPRRAASRQRRQSRRSAADARCAADPPAPGSRPRRSGRASPPSSAGWSRYTARSQRWAGYSCPSGAPLGTRGSQSCCGGSSQGACDSYSMRSKMSASVSCCHCGSSSQSAT